MNSLRLSLRPAVSEDESWLEQLRRDVYQELFVATFGAWDEARHQCQFADCLTRGEIWLVELDGERIGMLQRYERPDAIELGEIQLQPAQQSRGIGSQLLRDLLAQGRHVRLSVALKNERAHRFYLRLGFRDVSQSETHHMMEAGPAP